MTKGGSDRTAETTVRSRVPINIGIAIYATLNPNDEVLFRLGDLRVQ